MFEDCCSRKNYVKSNVVTSKNKMEDEWDAKVLGTLEEDELALMAMMGEYIDYENDWIINSRCSNHMTDVKGNCMTRKCTKKVVVGTTNNSQLPIAQIGNTMIILEDVQVYEDVKILGKPTMEGRKVKFVYLLSTKSAYVDKMQKNDTVNLWHTRLGHVDYHKLNVIMEKFMLKGQYQLEVKTDNVCTGCKYGKAHQLPYKG